MGTSVGTAVCLRGAAVPGLAEAGFVSIAEPVDGAVLVAAGATVTEALAACRPGERPLLVLADTLDSAGALRALRAGALAVLESASEPARLAAAVHAARHGEGRLPYEVLVGLLHGGAEPPARTRSPLTARQTAVLTLMAEGHDNAAIARTLSCSAHTVKNVIYDLMARLQVRNRSHAVASAVRAGLI
ncbi:helix-turn-helix transcriptional regulator [Actinophytocola gossypii]|uniref:DNA-binding response regulator n=1 Tax=Actinophytocola gossypii TaxID=2812003 RepID=A0ABT2JDE5_9PSEU|nr:LuxR C-terminal-related transcriptional regulator [Actinophytocola gossypii]MCT2585460.1 DNA-binding response regulator [Actinophytocola gossypii]